MQHFILLFLVVVLCTAAAAHDLPDGVPHHHPEDEVGPTSVFAHFPTSPDMYCDEVAAIIRAGVIDRFGAEEFAAVVLSHELHQHIGVYTVVGAKMGVRARELLDAPRRAVRVEVETQPDTPFACATDGLQAALGSTYGQDLIRIQPVLKPRLTVVFSYGGKRLRMGLKESFRHEIARIIHDNSEKHGYLSPAYFEAIRGASYRIWADWDRKKIFDETWIDAPVTER
ncbi:MAG TPA: formylmethanofuran dehydrogenase subunit E family protein [Candidatus Hydrogenedentes bacterium]|nr:formylmethanofuran dehydrogenase subunit E family protein [Candidatus Hydrogenedentota bacterium]HNT89039.1 formylmethanofuran dehydrogenase subunit E family protein [Candidatus Hydrogenedentota bacterium]